MLTIVMNLVKMVGIQSMIVLIHRTIQQVLRIITHQLSDPGRAQKKWIFPLTHKLGYQAPVVVKLNTRWLCMTMLVIPANKSTAQRD